MSWSLLLQMGGGAGGRGAFAFLGPLAGLLVSWAVVYLPWSASSGSLAPSTAETTAAMETLRKRSRPTVSVVRDAAPVDDTDVVGDVFGDDAEGVGSRVVVGQHHRLLASSDRGVEGDAPEVGEVVRLG